MYHIHSQGHIVIQTWGEKKYSVFLTTVRADIVSIESQITARKYVALIRDGRR